MVKTFCSASEGRREEIEKSENVQTKFQLNHSFLQFIFFKYVSLTYSTTSTYFLQRNLRLKLSFLGVHENNKMTQNTLQIVSDRSMYI